MAPRQPLSADALVVQVAIGSAAPVVSRSRRARRRVRPRRAAADRRRDASRRASFAVTVSAVAPAPAAPLAALVDVAVVEGVLGGLLFVMQAEKARIRRQARELFAARQVALATGDALDRLGAGARGAALHRSVDLGRDARAADDRDCARARRRVPPAPGDLSAVLQSRRGAASRACSMVPATTRRHCSADQDFCRGSA